MFLLYLDDSGSATNPTEQYFVLGGLSVFERRPFFISEQLDKLAASVSSDPSAVEFHASAIWRGKEAPWHTMKNPERKKVIKDVLSVLVGEEPRTCAFACAVHKPSYPNQDPVEIAFEELCNRFDRHLSRKYHNDNEKQRGLMIFDETTHETTLQGLATNFRKIGHRWGVTRNMSEVPLFVDSRASRCIQLADHIAYSVYRRYEHGDSSYLDQIAGRFDEENGKLHGLVHKNKTLPNCMCPACLTRRLSVSPQPPFFTTTTQP